MATYKKGSRSDEVKRIQEALGIEADGIYGSNTERAVRNYQQQNGLKVDGIVGNNTWGSLFGGSSGGWGPIPSGFSAGLVNTGIPSSGYSYNYSSSGSYANPDTAGKLASYENSRPKYSQSQEVTDAWNKVKELEGSKPADYVSKYGDQIQALLDKILNRDPFKYDFNADPMYQMYKDRYLQQGRMAMQDTMGDAAALTGGYGNSYAATAGQQAYQSYLQGLNDRIPDLRDFAYNAWLNEGDRMNSHLSILQGLDESDYARYRDKVGDYRDELTYYYNRFGDMTDREYNRYLNDAAAWEKDRDYWFNKWTWEQEFNYKTAAAAAAAAAGYGYGGSSGKRSNGSSAYTPKTGAPIINREGYATMLKPNGQTRVYPDPYININWIKQDARTKAGQQSAAWDAITKNSQRNGKYAAQATYNDAVKAGYIADTSKNREKLSGIIRSGR